MSQDIHRNASSAAHTEKSRKIFHKDWRVWLGSILMLGAMAMYVLTLDDSVVPRFFGK
jgi:hypothetical protein